MSEQNKKILVICLMGPTSSGKTDLAVQLHQQLPVDIISVDSAMVYRGMDIGTAKPDASVQVQAPHRLLDIRDPKDSYSVAEFVTDAKQAINEINQQGRIPLLVGGTMLYFRALQQGLSNLPAADPLVRAKIVQQAEQYGWKLLHQRLAKVDPDAAVRIHPNDPQRLQRALEVYQLTGRTITELCQESEKQRTNYQFINLSLWPVDRKKLRVQIAQRFALMLDQGLVAEVEALYQRGDLSASLPSLRSVGYRQVWQYLNGDLNYQMMSALAITATGQLAKRQLTWLKQWPEIICFRHDDKNLLRKCYDLIQETNYKK